MCMMGSKTIAHPELCEEAQPECPTNLRLMHVYTPFKKVLILVQIKVKCIKLMYITTLERDNSNSTIWNKKTYVQHSRQRMKDMNKNIYKLIKMTSVKTHGGKTIRSGVTQHTQKNFQKKFFPRSRLKYKF